MRLDLHQQMRMSQQMKLAPRMIQSMEILQLPLMALEQRIREEVEQNATIELGASTAELSTTDLEAELGDPNSTQEEKHGLPDEHKPDPITEPSDQEFEAYEQMYDDWNEHAYTHSMSNGARSELTDKRHEAMQNMEARPVALEDFLLEQLHTIEEDPLVVDFARYIIENLNDHGMLVGGLAPLQASFGKPITDDQAETALLIVQSLDPPGVGARDLRECLLLQMEEPHPEWKHANVLRTLIADHLDDLSHNRLPQIEKKSGINKDVLYEALEEMKHLTLNPASRFASTQNQYVTPDVFIDQDSAGKWIISTNQQSLPPVRISKHYLEMMKDRNADPKTLEYVKRKITAARWLIDAIEQRRNTLQRVAESIFEKQRGFLENGPEAIEPLKMQEIADKVNVHVTTVSRAVDDKWVQTPRGIFPLKRFFGGGTVTSTGEEVAWETIKRKMTEIIDAEDKNNPYSDDDLVKQLSSHGYPLARRTVTKYRKMLNIPSSRQRKVHM